ncbi:MAG: glycosyltransferase [Nitrospinaceae bacterium]|nr:glycosyltransferase family 2 protein [Nitrospinaceae bacterium]NIR55508.1 glycosyltransferase family 2 protein [Nitrospinaceae bacterium]NIS85941.1 glycosyltransferase family 2 protein [Nitrospinaceae bacterium]NIT82788.1 glycosyltransferase family 2 protein [Nitrospinaceae bacterium]NIU44992.1 glycosyltransferase family 2 protein [Nitrospinaceae bacterium]
MKVSVIIPTLNEARILEQTLRDLRRHEPHEVIVVDGGSRDDTRRIAGEFTPHVIRTESGRGHQMNAGARRATGDLFLFLHADSRVDPLSYRKMVSLMESGKVLGGAFSLAIDSDRRALRWISTLATLRARYLHLVYGDQGIFVRARVFRTLGGFSSLPICEDLDFFNRLRRQGPIVVLREKIFTSARRWRTEGVVYTTVRNILIAGLFLLGFPPQRLSKWYAVIR